MAHTPKGKADSRVRSPEFTKGNHSKNLGPGKSHAGYYTGGNKGRGQSTARKIGQLKQDHTMTKENVIPPSGSMVESLDFDRYAQAKDPLRQAMGVHSSVKLSPMMAQKYLGHSNPKVAAQAKKIVGGYHSSIGSNTQGPRSANQNSKA